MCSGSRWDLSVFIKLLINIISDTLHRVSLFNYIFLFQGVVPSTDFLKNSGVSLSSRGDVIVDKVSKADQSGYLNQEQVVKQSSIIVVG